MENSACIYVFVVILKIIIIPPIGKRVGNSEDSFAEKHEHHFLCQTLSIIASHFTADGSQLEPKLFLTVMSK